MHLAVLNDSVLVDARDKFVQTAKAILPSWCGLEGTMKSPLQKAASGGSKTVLAANQGVSGPVKGLSS